jgi:U3 small nucleolar RNA-associated protein 22
MFTHQKDYNVLIQLDPSILPRYHHNVSPNPSYLDPRSKLVNIQSSLTLATLRPGFDPASLLYRDLQSIYTDTFRIFYDPLGGDHFGLVWDPTLRAERVFKVMNRFSSVPVVIKKKEQQQVRRLKMSFPYFLIVSFVFVANWFLI